MAGLLADIGRSNVGATGQSIFGDIMRYRQMENQDSAQILTAQHQEKQMAIAQAAENRSQAEFDAKQQKAKQQVPLTMLWGPMETWSESRKAMVAEGTKMGLVKDVGGVPASSVENYEIFKKSLDPGKALELSAMNLNEHATDLGNIQKKLAKDPTNPELIAEKDRIFALWESQAKGHDSLATNLAAEKVAIEKAKGRNLGGPKFQSDSGEIFYQSPNGLVDAQQNPYDSNAHGNLKPIIDASAKDPVNDFQTFMAGEKEKNPNVTNAEISQAWHKLKRDEAAAAGEARGAAFAASRPVQVIDRTTGRGKVLSLADIEVANRLEPGRYEPIAGSPDFKADSGSLANQTKVRDMMAGFIGNMNKQIDRMGEITKDVKRFDPRILNVPLVKARTMIKGSPQESKINMYLTEISSEMGKVASGASASVAELSVETRKKWENIHDKNLSINDMMSLLRETQHAGKIRLQSSEQIIAETKKRFGGGNTGGGNTSDPYGIR